MAIKLYNKLFLSWDDIESITDVLAEKILALDKKPFYLYGCPRGGLIPAVILSHKTGIAYQHLNSAQLSKTADLSHIMVIDDICDSGKTVAELRGNYNKIRVATLHTKIESPNQPDIYGKVVGDEWIVYPWEKHNSETIQDYKLNEL
jgi:hypoxanthine phosphoribosyltransferase